MGKRVGFLTSFQVKSKLQTNLKRYLAITGGLVLLGFAAAVFSDDSPPANDNRVTAIELEDISDWCSMKAAYTTSHATGDKSVSSLWSTDHQYDVWFKFQAKGKDIHVEMKTGDTEGSLRHGYVALWDDQGMEIIRAKYVDPTSDIKIGHNNLTEGEWYYISVDNNDGSYGRYRGTFTLCVKSSLDNDWKEGATELTNLNNWCSEDAAWSTLWATPDMSTSSCVDEGPNFNRWFKFKATTKDIRVEMKTGDKKGTLKHGYLSLWDEAGAEITCDKFIEPTSDITISNNALTVGEWYYISVDNHDGTSGGYRGTFSLCVDTQLDNDWKEAAIELVDPENWCSPKEAWSTLWATADEPAGSCRGAGPNSNRWYKFQAKTKDIIVALKTGDDEGSLQKGHLSLWDDLGNELTCANAVDAYSDITISQNSLTPGNWYYIAVDNEGNESGSYRGTFSLCVKTGLDYDWKEAAIELTDLNNWTSPKAAYSTLWATADEATGSCLKTSPSYNRWFKFQATGKHITAEMKTGSSEGSLRQGYIALWDEAGKEISCAKFINATSDIAVSSNQLTPGEWYYISVDNNNSLEGKYRGTFTLAVDASPNYDWKEGAKVLNNVNEWCSGEQEYSTLWATADETAGTCQENGPSYNRWFSFQATGSDIQVEMKTGGREGSLRQGYVTLWDAAGNQVACGSGEKPDSDVQITFSSLTAGAWYHISVDNNDKASGRMRGTFTLCMKSVLDQENENLELTGL